MENKLKLILNEREQTNNNNLGVPSYCTASDMVIKAVLDNSAKTGVACLVEATANQVNQFGGYTGMKPADFVNFVYGLADEVNCPHENIILGGDHLGPLTFIHLPEEEAMQLSKDLVREYVLAGFTKIHLDTSMKISSDSKDEMLPTETIARRGAILFSECMKAFDEIEDPNKVRPAFIIGSEVPIPGGATEDEEGISVTKVADFKDTIDTYNKVFAEVGYAEAMKDIVGLVVQPGVEFGDSQVFMYEREPAKELCEALKEYDGIFFEGHSTDYQTREALKEMVQDGIAILKVGPALTFRYREALFALSFMEKVLFAENECANFMETLEKVMMEKPENWQKHLHGTDHEKAIARRYSYSDRARYYFADPEVKASIDKLLANFRGIEIPMNVLHQFMPNQYQKVIRGQLANELESLLFDSIMEIAGDYEYACH